MKRLILILFFLLMAACQLDAQWNYGFGYKPRRHSTVPAVVGIKGGLTSYNMVFSNEQYNKLPGESVSNPGFGVFFEYPIAYFPCLSVGAELMMIERGMRKTFDYRGYIKEIDEIDAKYFDLRIPVTYYFYDYHLINPYVFVAADMAFSYGGFISKTFPDGQLPDHSVDISKSDAVIASLDISVLAGLGLRCKIRTTTYDFFVKIDGGYNFGLLNTFSKNNGVPVDVYAYSFDKNDTRKNRGLEFMISFGFPLKSKIDNDPCRSWF
ncbi:MAG: outer membrane beta-barrel protein [Bacteroidales bacterium]|nr:outer membrane beta-barrel protein [Bacteroidales bacterium]